jgi:hypothetical protein
VGGGRTWERNGGVFVQLLDDSKFSLIAASSANQIEMGASESQIFSRDLV